MTYCAFRDKSVRCGEPAVAAVRLPLPAKLAKRYPDYPVETTPEDFRCERHKALLQNGGLGYVIEFPFEPSPPRESSGPQAKASHASRLSKLFQSTQQEKA